MICERGNLILRYIYLYIHHYEPLWMYAQVWGIFMKFDNGLEWQWQYFMNVTGYLNQLIDYLIRKV